MFLTKKQGGHYDMFVIRENKQCVVVWNSTESISASHMCGVVMTGTGILSSYILTTSIRR